MGCILSFFTRGTYVLHEGQLTDKLLKGATSEEATDGEAEKEPEHGDISPPHTPSQHPAAAGDRSQDEDDVRDEAMLLGALGATGAGAVTVGAVAGALKAAQDRGDTTPSDAGGTARSAASPTSPAGDGGAALASAAAVGTGGVLAAAASGGAADAQREGSGTPKVGSGQSTPRSNEAQGEQSPSAPDDSRSQALSTVDEDPVDESSRTPVPEDWGEDASQQHALSRASLEGTETKPQSPSAGVAEFSTTHPSRSGSSQSRSPADVDRSTFQSPKAEGVSPSPASLHQDSPRTQSAAFGELNRPHSGSATSKDRTQSPHEAESPRPQSTQWKDRSREESPSLDTHTTSDIRDDARIQSPPQYSDFRAESSAFKDDSRTHSPTQSEKYHSQSVAAGNDSPIQAPAEGASRLQSATMNENDPHFQHNTEGEDFRAQSASAAHDARVQSPAGSKYSQSQSPAVDDDSRVQSRTKGQYSQSQSAAATDDTGAQSPISQGSRAQSAATADDAEIRSNTGIDNYPAHSVAVEDDSRMQSPTDDAASTTRSSAAKDDSHLQTPTAGETSPTEPAAFNGDARSQSAEDVEGARIQSPSIRGNFSARYKEEMEVSRTHSAAAAGDNTSNVPTPTESAPRADSKADEDRSDPRSDLASTSPAAEATDKASASPSRSETGLLSGLPEDRRESDTGAGERGSTVPSRASADASRAASASGIGAMSPTQSDRRSEVETPEIVPQRRVSNLTPDKEKHTEEFMQTMALAAEERSEQQNVSGEQEESLHTPDHKVSAPSLRPDSSIKSEGADKDHHMQVDLASRTHSSTDAVLGSATDIQDETAIGSSPIPSVFEEPFVKADRFVADSDAALISGDPPVVSAEEADQTPIEPSLSVAEDVRKTSDVMAADAKSPADAISMGDTAFTEEQPSRPATAEEAALDASDRTEDNDFDPLAQTQSVIFPDELEGGRTSQISEKPSSPFPELQDDDTRTDSALAQFQAEQAATKIQAGVRGWQARRKISQQNAAATQIQAGFRGWKVRRERRMKRATSLPDMSQDHADTGAGSYMDVDTLKNRAASKIQAGFRGWRTRQEMKTLAIGPLEGATRVSPAISMVDVGPEDQAATKIQAGYRGWKTRRMLKRSLSDPNSEALVLAEGLDQRTVGESGCGRPEEVPTPREEDETAHSIQSIQSEVASSAAPTPRQDRDPANPPRGPEPSAADEAQMDEAAARIQAGYRGWKTRQSMRAGQSSVRPTVSAKSVTDSGALPIDFAIVHRPEDDWLAQDTHKLKSEKETDVADGRADDDASTESSSSWLTRAHTEIRASFQGLRENVSDALKTVEDTAKMVRDKGAAADVSGIEVVPKDIASTVEDKGGALLLSGGSPGNSTHELPRGEASGSKQDGRGSSENSEENGRLTGTPGREEEEIWEEIQRHMHHED
ncbi:uncharacterized protein LOC119110100 isoform X2 [Pollicipes pollicipes]|uniref:uncharacterized protein LOC119110100 isoform X2 n=1 Tax=Pollicipes pollicipes TaxID=41117 RepID=UPI001884DB36|nr:uncharacterized protein LOC119110100 isoform X2 [Pollicipes pollicipes]